MNLLSDAVLRQMIFDVVKELDYDAWKGLQPELSDVSPEEVEEQIQNLVTAAKRSLSENS